MIIKCKMCGGDLNVQEGNPVCECEFCGTQQTIPQVDDEKKANLFNRANKLRMNADFDKAATVYASITAEFPEEAEAYWGLCLCKYGIEYVDDPASGKKIPTCHRTLTESIMDDSDFDQACENADSIAMRLYREEAKTIDRLQKGILEIVASEKPYDVFICYKETDENGERTEDSVLAQEIYDALTGKGLKVFFSRISLEDKLGQQYEPYIYAALSSAKVMLAVGTRFEFYNAAWVKNEWSRFLEMMKTDKDKKLIPCFKNLDAYDVPKEFGNLQAQDMGKIGWLQDLVRGVGKLLGDNKNEDQAESQTQENAASAQLTASVKRGYLALEDKDWEAAEKFFDTALNFDAECADAYIGLALADIKVSSTDSLFQINEMETMKKLEAHPSFVKFTRFAADEKKDQIIRVIKQVKQRLELSANQSKNKLERTRDRIRPAKGLLAMGMNFMAGVQTDGQVKIYKLNDRLSSGRSKISNDFYGLVSVAIDPGQYAGTERMIGVRQDGTVVSGENASGQVASLKNVKQAASQLGEAVVLKDDGSVIRKGSQTVCAFDDKKPMNVSFMAVSDCNIVGIRQNGTVAVESGVYNYGMSEWDNIVDISVMGSHAAGLRSDGTVLLSAGMLKDLAGRKFWKDIVSVSIAVSYLAGLRSDGTVILSNRFIEWRSGNFQDKELPGWSDIVDIETDGFSWLAGLKADGTVLLYNFHSEKTETVKDWKLFDSIDTLEEERTKKLQPKMEEMKIKAQEEKAKAQAIEKLQSEQARLRKELENLTGLFTGKRRKEIEDRIWMLDNEIRKIR